MKKERKMLISIVLVLIMLLNCIMPIVAVYAETNSNETTVAPATEITFENLNYKLFEALKAALTAQNKAFTYNSIEKTIVIPTEVANSIEELNLESKGISDLTGLENLSSFTSLKVLDLSGNNLTKDSNLAVLNSITTLVELDLSTNQLEDISEIASLMTSIESKGGNVDITSQTVVTVVDFAFSKATGKVEKEVQLPQILEYAGFLKAMWKTEKITKEKGSASTAPYISLIPLSVNSNNNNIKVVIGQDETAYKGLVKFEIYVHDDATEAGSAANLNPAATNKLKDSRFTLYVVVHDSESTAITTPDTHLFNAVKEQLSKGQTVNTELASYPFAVNKDGEILYDKCKYETIEAGILKLTVVGESTPKYVLDLNENEVYLYDASATDKKGDNYTNIYEKTAISETDNSGVVTIYEGYIIPHTGENINLYKDVYDEAKTFVIEDKVLINKITSLILNNKQIYDLTGIEKFVGLKSYLNVSHNYLSNIEPIYDLNKNKDEYEKKLQEKYINVLNTRDKDNLQFATDKTQEAKNESKTQLDNISKTVDEIKSKLEEISKLDTTAQNYSDSKNNLVKQIEELSEKLYDKTITEIDGTTKTEKGYTTLLKEALTKVSAGITSVNAYLEELYDIYNNHYRLLTLLTPDLNYQNIEEYDQYLQKMNSNWEDLAKAQISKLTDLESKEALTNLEKKLISAVYTGIDFNDPEKSISKYFAEHAISTTDVANFKKIALYSEMSNYCTLKRMNTTDVLSDACHCKEYLENRIEEFGYEGIDTSVEEKILEDLDDTTTTTGIHGAFNNYVKETFIYKNGTTEKNMKMAIGEFAKITDFNYAEEKYTESELASLSGGRASFTGLNVTKKVTISEIFEESNTEYTGAYATRTSTTTQLYYYDETMVIAKRLLAASGEVSRYITLPDLKKLDVSYNSYLEGFERLSELTALRELSANSNYLEDLSIVDWNALHYLRKLELNNNFIKDITPLEVLDHIEILDVSHNLLAGELKFNFTKMQETLKDLNLSYNKIDNITTILQYLDFKADGNFANYLAREDTININLSNQTINLNVVEPIVLRDYPETVNVDLPIIFTQLKAIDVERTEFDYDHSSQVSRIESEGKYATLNTKTVGEKKAIVNVATINGKETCIGDGTQAIINYVVSDATVNEIKVSPNNVKLSPEDTQKFEVEIIGEHLKESDKGIRWEVRGNVSAETVIENGELTLGKDETAEAIEVVAISLLNGVEGVATVNVAQREITKFEITPNTAKIIASESAEFTLTIDGENLRDQDKEVEWTVNSEEDATIGAIYAVENNVLKLGIDETSEEGTLTITATSKFDSTKVATATVTVERREVTEIKVTPVTARIEKGQSQEFTAVVTGKNLRDEDKGIEWSIIGKNSAATQITENGVLTVGKDETATTLKIKATSKFDGTSYGEATIELYERKITTFTITPETATVEKGKTQQFNVIVAGENLSTEDKAVRWEIIGKNSTTTQITENGVLTVGKDETATTITVKAESVLDSTKVVTATVTVKSADPSATAGYTVEGEYLLGIATKTPIDSFKEKMAKDYTVIVKEEGKVVTSGYIKTGMTVEVQDNEGNTVRDNAGDLLVYEIIVKGDINKDGVADALDSNIIKAYRNEVAGVNLLDAQKRAADINEDGSIDTNDSKLLLYHRAEVKNYCLDFKLEK